MSNAVSSTIFAFRNYDKYQNGDVGRLAVAGAQSIKVFDKIMHYNDKMAKTADSALKAFNTLAEHNKLVDYAGKTVKWATKNVNPMICASGVLKVAMSENKPKDAIVEPMALATMFAGEGLMKSGLLTALMTSVPVKSITKYLCNAKFTKPWMNLILNTKASGKFGAIIRGILFVAGSIASYSIGQKVGEDIYSSLKARSSTSKNINLKS